MANLNKVMFIGRLTRDPEMRTFTNGGKVAKFGFAVNFIRSKKNPTTGEWEGGEAAFIDVEAFNRENGRPLADQVEQRLRKGQQVFIEGRLRMNEWTDQQGQKRTKLLVVADNIEFLDSRPEGISQESSFRPTRTAPAPRQPEPQPDYPPPGDSYEESEPDQLGPSPGKAEDIPF